ncbi:hypothetical protein ACEE23_05535 [Corynebacterium sp. 32222D000AT]|uniref:hypothetical protein n=1 Tax=unclassified Corynebacterium TaxID=2624378 RepID=UPI002A936B92|nr:hypothetical protein [Mycobacteriaceae bacterium]MDY5830012.1 hypothetical protein [Corynebacterium sp.]
MSCSYTARRRWQTLGMLAIALGVPILGGVAMAATVNDFVVAGAGAAETYLPFTSRVGLHPASALPPGSAETGLVERIADALPARLRELY